MPASPKQTWNCGNSEIPRSFFNLGSILFPNPKKKAIRSRFENVWYLSRMYGRVVHLILEIVRRTISRNPRNPDGTRPVRSGASRTRKERTDGTLRTPEKRLPSGAPKDEFGRMTFQKKSSLGDHSKGPRQLLVEVRRGTGTCDTTFILDHHCSSASL